VSVRLPPPLVALTPGDLGGAGVHGLLTRAARAVEAGLRGVLLREPRLDDRAFLELACALRDVLGESGWLGVHDRVHLAPACRADTVHLGFRSLPVDALPEACVAGRARGLSTHADDGPDAWFGADYLFHGPVRSTPSKEGLIEPVGMEGLRAAVECSPAPVWAIGGIEPADARPALQAGASGVAVLRGVLGAADPASAAAAYLAALGDRA
jgi:thiamine-phosphate diphosphorylase